MVKQNHESVLTADDKTDLGECNGSYRDVSGLTTGSIRVTYSIPRGKFAEAVPFELTQEKAFFVNELLQKVNG